MNSEREREREREKREREIESIDLSIRSHDWKTLEQLDVCGNAEDHGFLSGITIEITARAKST